MKLPSFPFGFSGPRAIGFILVVAIGSPGVLAETRTVKKILQVDDRALNQLDPEGWKPWQEGFTTEGDWIVCDNGNDGKVHRGAGQPLVLNQATPAPIMASVWSKAEQVGGQANAQYALYLDLVYMDGTPLWGQSAAFSVGTHDWQRREVVVMPTKPVRQVSVYLLLREHTGKAWFRDPVCYALSPTNSTAQFDGQAVIHVRKAPAGFQVRDVAAGSNWVTFRDGQGLGLKLATTETVRDGVTYIDAQIEDLTGTDRAITLVYTWPVDETGWQWLEDPRRDRSTASAGEYTRTTRSPSTGNRRLSSYPLAAVSRAHTGRALGLDLNYPAFFRTGYSADTRELYVAYDLGLAPEKPTAHLRFCRYTFDPEWGFRAALKKYQEIYPEFFTCRTPRQGVWMPFAKISAVQGWQDFGFLFKEGTNETAWDDARGILTFRYTEPQTWWMRMAEETPRTMDSALAQARAMAEQGNRAARALFTSGYHDEHGQLTGTFQDTPWCKGIVWSVNSAPGVPGQVTDFKNCWNETLQSTLYGPERKADLDGEYIDSSEGYVTAELNYRRDHFAGMETPLSFSSDTHKPAIFRGLAVYEYTRAQARDVHALNKLMMANSTPSRLCWLAPWLDIMGSETDWNRQGAWRPMPDEDLLYRRAMCGPKPFCFLMNTEFENFPGEKVEKYMQRCLAYGMFPGFFSHNASEGHYFSRPELYQRDRALFMKYIPLCRQVAEAGWQPVTRARSDDPKVYVERFGDRYLTVFNDSAQPRKTTISLHGIEASRGENLLTGHILPLQNQAFEIRLQDEEVAVVHLRP